MSVTLERPAPQTVSYQEIYDWLYSQAEKLGLQISLVPENEQMQSGMLSLPVHIKGAADAYDHIVKLKKLENTWNDREPRREPPLFLSSAKDPVQIALWDRIDQAALRKMRAADALADAATEADERAALAELRAARADERQAERENEVFNAKKSVA